jgi:hypothetical protein
VDIASTTPVTASPVTTADELALFVKQVGSDPRIHFRQISSGTEVQLTGADPIAMSNGETTLMGGIGIKWGITGVINNVVTPFTYAGFGLNDFGTATWSVVLTSTTNRTVSVQNLLASGFSATAGGIPLTLAHWIAIGI